jgi:hypothetical protein
MLSPRDVVLNQERHHTSRERGVRPVPTERHTSDRSRWPVGGDGHGWRLECGRARHDFGRRGRAR